MENEEVKMKQEVFDKCHNHLIKQGKQSLRYNDSGYNTCMYRSEEGLSCAIGCFVDDETAKEMDGKSILSNTSIDTIIKTYPEILPKWMLQEGMPAFLSDLQNAHDNYFDNVRTLNKQMKKIAIKYGIEA